VESDNIRHFSRRDARRFGGHAQYQALRSGDAQTRQHPLRGGLQAVLNAPQEPHEIEDWIKRQLRRRLTHARNHVADNTRNSRSADYIDLQ
jgi:hypothetical protein